MSSGGDKISATKSGDGSKGVSASERPRKTSGTSTLAKEKPGYADCKIEWELLDFVYGRSIRKENFGQYQVILGDFDRAIMKSLNEWSEHHSIRRQIFELVSDVVDELRKRDGDHGNVKSEYLRTVSHCGRMSDAGEILSTPVFDLFSH